MRKVIFLFLIIILSTTVLAYEMSWQGTVYTLGGSSLGANGNLTIEFNDSNVMIFNQTWTNGIYNVLDTTYGFDVIIGRDNVFNPIYGKNYTVCLYTNQQLQGSCYIWNAATGNIDGTSIVDGTITITDIDISNF